MSRVLRASGQCLLLSALLPLSPVLAQHRHAAPEHEGESTALKHEAPHRHVPPEQAGDYAAMQAEAAHAHHHDHDHPHPPASTQAAPSPALAPPTQAELQAAFPPVHAHHRHGTSIHNYTLFDRLERPLTDVSGFDWEASGWVGGDIHKLQWRSEGHVRDGALAEGRIDLLHARAVRPWWDTVAGLGHEKVHGIERNWLALGVQGMMPYKFETQATLSLGSGGRSALHLEGEYDTLFSNRLILQWRAGVTAYGRDDPALGRGRGLATASAGLRLRYEIRRQFAPYVGIEHQRLFGRSAEAAEASGEAARQTHWLAGLRFWF